MKPTYRNLKITAKLLDGRVATYDGYLPLDSMLAYAKVERDYPELLETNTEMQYIDLPLQKKNDGTDKWYWACSFACFEPRGESSRFWHKRFDQEHAEEFVDFQGKRGNVNVKSAKYKNYRVQLPIILTPEITWYCVGEPTEIKELLKYITHIGKKPAQGLGAVKEWLVEEIDEDLSWLRPVPDDNGDDELGIRPPYWYRENIMRVKWANDPRLGAR